ncbi:hypothetical protein KCU71_g4943, partial [Aureobasidium melanogenum]
MRVDEIILRIQDQLPGTNYEKDAVMDIIRNIDSINLSDRAIKSRAEKIIRAYYRLQGELHHAPGPHSRQPTHYESIPPNQDTSADHRWRSSLAPTHHEPMPPMQRSQEKK